MAASTIDIASGQLTGSDLVGGPGGWTSGTLNYDVDYDDVTGYYTYSYSLDDLDPQKAISHVIIQTSDNFTSDDILSGSTSGGIVDTYSGSDNSNVGMPADITGIKWNTTGDPLSLSWTLVTLRAPIWGNFYAVDGKKPNEEVYIYNSGFDLVAAGTAPSCYLGLFYDFSACSGFLLVPDTIEGPPDEPPGDPAVPEPASLILLGTGLAGVALGARRRQRR